MKRYITIVAVAIAALSCSKTYDVNPASQKAIGFGTWAENLTRARVQGTNTFVSGDDFAVYGSKVTGSAAAVTEFDDVVVSYDGSKWAYSPARFWDPSTDSYTFYAVSPAAIGTAATVTPATGVVASASVTFAGNDNDILVADEKTVAKANYGSTVELQFNHIASLVDFKVKKHADLGDAVLAVTSFSISNIDNAGTFAVSSYSSTHPVVAWTASAHAGNYSNASGVASVTLPSDVDDTTPDFLIDSLIVMPQTFRTDANIQTVNIEYTITDEASNVSTFTKSFNLKLFDDVDDTDNEDTVIPGWEGGKHYVFIITINSSKIEFSAAITDWTLEADGYNYLLN
ncbi:MAG: fimbrillin family protein [Bacteroidales bacterium]|nr:fimbrillin family protein [Bacteroidales bacterium]